MVHHGLLEEYRSEPACAYAQSDLHNLHELFANALLELLVSWGEDFDKLNICTGWYLYYSKIPIGDLLHGKLIECKQTRICELI